MELNALYDIAEREKILVKEKELEKANGIYTNYNDKDIILLNKTAIKSNAEELCVFAEELGHYFCNACYDFDNINETLIRKAENRANKWAYSVLVNMDKVEKMCIEGYYNFEIAEELGITQQFLESRLYG